MVCVTVGETAPDRLSTQVHVRVTLTLFQPFALAAGLRPWNVIVGGVLSMSMLVNDVVAVLPTLSAQLPETDWSFRSADSVAGAVTDAAFTPDPPSVHEKLTCTLWVVQVPPTYGWFMVVIAVAVIAGALRSTLMPLSGPAVAQLPTASQTWWVPVEALAVSVPAGTLVVHGSTDEYYAVMNNAGGQLASAHLEKPLAFVPGTYNVKVNNTTTPATIVSGVTTEVKTGAVVLQGTTDEYYAIIDSAGTQLASAHLGRALSLMPGAYRAKLNNIAMTVQVDAGHSGEYQSGSLTVKTAGSDYYAVLDASGTQLVSKQVNQPVSVPAGKYSVRLGNNSRPATVTAGQSVVLNW